MTIFGNWIDLLRACSDSYATALRAISLQVDEPKTDWTFWAYLAAEIGLGAGALASASRRAGASRDD